LSGKSVRFPSDRAACIGSKATKSPAPKNEVREPDQFDRCRPDPTRKIIRFFFAPKRVFLSASRLDKGRIAIVTERGVGCGGRGGVDTTSDIAADGEIVWFWRSDAGAKFAGSAGDGGNQAWSPGRARISRKTIAQGRPGILG
jgi:hypothetical protein